MKTHHLKLNEKFCDAVISGDKNFEIRFNDRDYQVGDHVIFQAWGNHFPVDMNPINSKEYEIIYVLSGWGLKDGYVAFATKEITDEKH
ncbi:MAG: DUF3850 domain-containing protein [Lachnospiraceae bacterium]|nr:DUF3850 domain-containing protein [Lachnospiraceae bacterium]